MVRICNGKTLKKWISQQSDEINERFSPVNLPQSYRRLISYKVTFYFYSSKHQKKKGLKQTFKAKVCRASRWSFFKEMESPGTFFF
jgi:hypothetical protein